MKNLQNKGIMDIGVIIVTYNRLEKLKTALKKFDEQTALPKYIMVINNASTDETEKFLSEWKNSEDAGYRRIAINKTENTGGSGGFYTGLEAAIKEDAKWVWVSDDDAFPRKDALKNAGEFIAASINNSGRTRDISAVCGIVMNGGTPDRYQSRSFYIRGIRICEKFPDAKELKQAQFEKNTLTYVGSIINIDKLKEVGLPNKDYFIYYDDTEHGMRLAKAGKIICRTNIIVDHDTPSETDKVTWKTYYRFRNMTDVYRKHFGGIYFSFFAFKVKLKSALNKMTGNKNTEICILEEAYNDAVNGRFGMHKIYKPGWKL